jgi:putative oxidoreductase
MAFMTRWSSLAPILGRILLGGFFIWNGLEEATNLSATTNIFIHLNLPSPAMWAVGAVILEVAGGIALVTNTRSRLAALLLAIYVALSSVVLVGTSGAPLQIFLENLAIAGGLLCISA